MKLALGLAFGLLMLACFSSAAISNKTADPNNRNCPDNANPFNLPRNQYKNKLPAENLNRGGWGGPGKKNPEDMHHMVFKWIPRESVTCQANQLPLEEQLKTFRFTENEGQRSINAHVDCVLFINSWLAKLKTVTLHDLLVVIKAKAITLFNSYYDLKISRFGPDKLICDMGEEVIEVLEKLQQDLKDGFILPNEAGQPSYEDFMKELADPIKAYRDIQRAYSRSRVTVQECKYEPILNKEKSRKDCINTVLAHVTGKQWMDANQPVATGYGFINLALDKAVRVITGYFDKPLEYNTSLPNVMPCFKNE